MRFFRWVVPLFVFAVCVSCVSLIMVDTKISSVEERLGAFPVDELPLDAEAAVYWNDFMVPFVEAQTDADCAFIIGMIHAHLRLGQMTVVNRAAQGRLSESAGFFTAGADHFIRSLQIDKSVDAAERDLPAETQSWLENFVRGINYYQDQLEEYPPEFKPLNIEPEPWTVRQILVMGKLMGADVNWFNWISWLKFTDKPYWDKIWERLLNYGMNSIPSVMNEAELSNALLNLAGKSGSNAFAVGAGKSADSCAVIASDPHLGLMLPNMWITAGYKCPSYHTVGLMFPGIPMILVGRNEHIAWAGTNMRSASSDVYRLTPEDLKDAGAEEETIKVRLWFDRKIVKRFARHGAVVSDSPLFKAGENETLALKWVGHAKTDEFTTFLKVNRAADWDEFVAAFETYGVSGQNFIYADVQGRIGSIPAVMIPRRQYKEPEDLVLDSTDPSALWDGFLKPVELPAVLNPESGFLASANNLPFEHDPPLGFFFSPNDRIERLHELLSAKDKIDVDYIRQMQRDVYVGSACRLKQNIMERLDRIVENEELTAETQRFLDILRDWDGRYEVDSQGAAAFQLYLFHLIRRYVDSEFDKDMRKYYLKNDKVAYFVAEDLARISNEKFRAALKNAVGDFDGGKEWGDLHRLRLRSLLGYIPVLGKKFRYGDYPVAGTYNSLMKTAHDIDNREHQAHYGANARFISKMSGLNDNWFVLLGGQDGWLGGESMIDQFPLWQKGEYMKIPMEIRKIKEEFKFQHRLQNKNGVSGARQTQNQ